MNTLLEAEHLTKVFAQRGKEPFKVVDDVSFSLQAGETLGIVGESGSGKSTLAKMITRLTDITDGTLKFQGKDITKLKQRNWTNIRRKGEHYAEVSRLHLGNTFRKYQS